MIRLRIILLITAAAGVASAVTPGVARGQACIGVPMQHVRAGFARNDNGTNTLIGGLKLSELGSLTLNYAMPDNPPNGSKLISFGGRAYYGFDRNGLGICMLIGYQRGYASLRNADGLRMNGHLTTSSLPAAMSFSLSVINTRAARLMLFVMPQVILQSHSMELVGRSDTLSVEDNPIRYGFEGGAAVAIGPVRVSATAIRIRDLPNGWSIGAGVAW